MTTTNDSHLAKMASNEAKQPDLPEAEDYVTKNYIVPVRQDSADQVTYFTAVVATGTNPVALLLPRDPNRYRATIMAIDEAVVLAATRDQAGNSANTVTNVPAPQGFYLPVSIPVTVYAKGPCYVGATSATPTRVSVTVEKYEQDA
jgi:hypothetical protein